MATVRELIERGVTVFAPETVYLGPEVNPERISGEGVVIHPGCRIRGERSVISARCELGAEAPLTIDNCALGQDVKLKGGYATDSVFLAGVEVGSGAQLREACLLEEQSAAAHNVGLKQTILFPYATIGSLVNFCDCLLAGGTSRSNHAEVGSGYIHFNFTPAGHKATASLFGDVVRGVWLREQPVFLGGGGGAVGPVRVGYGAVVGAGSILKDDVPDDTQVVVPGVASTHPVKRFAYPRLARVVAHNVEYIAQLLALKCWYQEVRAPLYTPVEYGNELLEAALRVIDAAIGERTKRFAAFTESVRSEDADARRLRERGGDVAGYLAAYHPRLDPELARRITVGEQPYLATLSALDDETVITGQQALAAIVAEVTASAQEMLHALPGE